MILIGKESSPQKDLIEGGSSEAHPKTLLHQHEKELHNNELTRPTSKTLVNDEDVVKEKNPEIYH